MSKIRGTAAPIADVLGCVGVVMVSVGAGMIYRPAGIILGGVLLIALALFGFKPVSKDS